MRPDQSQSLIRHVEEDVKFVSICKANSQPNNWSTLEGAVDISTRNLSFTRAELAELIKLVPEAQDLYIPDKEKPGKFLLAVGRDIFKMGVANRKLYRTSYGDGEADIANFLIAAFEHMQEKKRTLVLEKPYQNLSYPERTAALINQGFLKLRNAKMYINENQGQSFRTADIEHRHGSDHPGETFDRYLQVGARHLSI